MSVTPEIFRTPSALKCAITLNTWESLSDDQKSHLLMFLPKSLNDKEKNETLMRLFSGENLTAFSSISSYHHSGNPVDDFVAKLESGYYSKEVCTLRRCQRQAVKAKAKYEKSRYYHDLLKEVIVSRQCHLAAVTFPQCYKLIRSKNTVTPVDSDFRASVEKSAENFYRRVLREVKLEAKALHNYSEEDLLSSGSDSDDGKLHVQGAKSLQNGSTSSQIKDMLIQHQRRLAANVNTPDLNLDGMKFGEVSSRTYGTSKKSATLLRKRKRAESAKLSKQKKLKLPKPDKESKKERKMHGMRERATATTPSCYFELVRDVIKLTSDHSFQSIQLLVSDWLTSAEASRYDWTNNFTNWKELVQSALNFLANKKVLDNNDSALVRHEQDSWMWKSQLDGDSERNVLLDLCKEWLVEVADQLIVPSSDESLHSFHEQERRRFQYAHQAFVYSIDGVRYPVPPVKGTAGPVREGRVAREHCLLKSERPPQVTILALTRDAVARLPGGRGSRSLVCSLLRDSQYLAPVVTESQINLAVSGALDRLHYEFDPCVEYNSSDKVWLYLHAGRTPEELERIHCEQLGAPKKKRDRSIKKSKQKHAESKKKPKSQIKSHPSEGPTDPGENLAISSGRDLNTQLQANSNAEKPSSINIVNCSKSIPTRTIQVTQKQFMEMTRKLSDSSTSGGARDLLMAQVDKKANSQAPVVGTVFAKAQLPQTGLKLILKPGASDVAKPMTDLSKVDPVAATRSQGNQPMLSADALRRLTEQLSAMSSRPIKIVQRNLTSPQAPSRPGSRIINITSRPSPKLPSNSVVQTANVLSEVGQRNTKTVFISRFDNNEVTSRTVDEPRVVHIVQRNSKTAKTERLNADRQSFASQSAANTILPHSTS